MRIASLSLYTFLIPTAGYLDLSMVNKQVSAEITNLVFIADFAKGWNRSQVNTITQHSMHDDSAFL